MVGIIVGAAGLHDEKNILLEYINKAKSVNGQEMYIIAADGGMSFFVEEEICPNEWIGDMDSASSILKDKVKDKFPNIRINACSPIKDDTDMAIAANILINNGCDNILIFGGMGGSRIEHSIANIQLMHHLILQDIKVTMYSENSIMYCVKDAEVCFDEKETGYISVFSLSDSSEIDIKGLFYEYTGMLSCSYALGVSNEFCGKSSSINVKNGVVLVVQSP